MKPNFMNPIRAALRLASAIIVFLFVDNATAAIVAVNSRAALGSNLDTVNWAGLGPEFTTPANPFTISSGIGLPVTVSKSSPGSFERVNEGGFGWVGNFALNDALLWTSLTPGPLTIAFDSPVSGVGFQIQNDSLGAFQATLEAFNTSNTSLGSFNFNGNSTQLQDNSAIFAGLLSTTRDVSRVTVNVTGSSSFAINNVSLAGAIPEPGTALFGAFCAAPLLTRRAFRRLH